MFRFLWATGTPLSGHRFLFWMMATTAAIAYTAEAMELIAAQMLSVGLLLSIDNYYNNKVCKVIKGGGTRCAYLVLRSTVPCRPCRDCHQAPMPLR